MQNGAINLALSAGYRGEVNQARYTKVRIGTG